MNPGIGFNPATGSFGLGYGGSGLNYVDFSPIGGGYRSTPAAGSFSEKAYEREHRSGFSKGLEGRTFEQACADLEANLAFASRLAEGGYAALMRHPIEWAFDDLNGFKNHGLSSLWKGQSPEFEAKKEALRQRAGEIWLQGAGSVLKGLPKLASEGYPALFKEALEKLDSCLSSARKLGADPGPVQTRLDAELPALWLRLSKTLVDSVAQKRKQGYPALAAEAERQAGWALRKAKAAGLEKEVAPLKQKLDALDQVG